MTVPINDHLIAKTNLFPERVNWSILFMQEFMWRIKDASVVPVVELETL